MVSLKRKAVSICCALTLATSLVPVSALAEESSPNESLPDASLQEGVAQGEDAVFEIAEPVTIDAETSADVLSGISLFSLESVGPVPLKSSHEIEWIDRIDFTGHQSARDFYDVLVEATDNDGVKDYLIEDAYFDQTASSVAKGQTGGYDEADGRDCIVIGPISYSGDFNDAFYEELIYAYAAVAAFDRDHPEVFWLEGGASFTGWGIGSNLYLGYVIKSDRRLASFSSQQQIKTAISKRDADAQRILDKAIGCETSAEKMTVFNDELTKINAYNTSRDLNAASKTYPEGWRCISALEGRTGSLGPVCEGYARAFKVLCDKSDIPCVLVDGKAKSQPNAAGGAHMWNYAQADDGNWYAVDVTWNDPNPGNTPVSGYENTKWLLVGSATVVSDMPFSESHPVVNRVFSDGATNSGLVIYQQSYTNGPQLNKGAYIPPSSYQVDFPCSSAVYGQHLKEVALGAPTAVSKEDGSELSVAARWENENEQINRVGSERYRAICTIRDGETSVQQVVEVPVLVSEKELAVIPGVVASKTYDGTVKASFSSAPRLEGVVSGDDVKLTATASFADAAAGNAKKVTITYALSGADAGNYRLSQTSVIATANITAPEKPETPSTPAQPTAPSNPSTGSTTAPTVKPSTPAPPSSGSSTTTKPAPAPAPAPSKPATSPSTPAKPTAKPAAKAPTFKETKILKLKSSKKKTLAVTWKKATKSPVKYQVQYSTDKKFKKGVKTATIKVTKKLSRKSSLSTTVKKLKSKKTYYVRVRAKYSIAGKTYNGPWTATKKVKVK